MHRQTVNAETAFGWAQSYFEFGDFANARKWYARRVEMGGSGEELFLAKYRLAASMHKLAEPWPQVQDAYLRAWTELPSRAEPLHAIARRYRSAGSYHLGYLFARRAAMISRPEHDHLAVDDALDHWRAMDELAVCAAWIGKKAEAFDLCRKLIALPDLPEPDRQRIAKNRDLEVPVMLEAASAYPQGLLADLTIGGFGADVTVTVIADADRAALERTLNSFLNCCQDLALVERFLVLDTGLSGADRRMLRDRYRFVDVIDADPYSAPGDQLRELRGRVPGRFWLHLGRGWQFFAPDHLMGRLRSVLQAEPQVFQVGVNVGDATELIGECAPEPMVRRSAGTGRYLRSGAISMGPAMFDTTRLDQATAATVAHADVVGELGRVGWCTATLDEVLCSVQISAPPA
ncbi:MULTISPECIES: hypothetical protein [Mycolicibacter]|uniref:Uncharacterized protein n=1 Tax=[Mycobacterium] vasticus TaxID=2875777 RepID=A0ABU5Z3V7_9MYCO|nr:MULTISPECIES: hypothetical protein [unclassified Mycolicibacter]MEB3065737.1 hypothetical protein [Mycolicibacter sp. MYC101]MEB3071761.1 hypothetical protein [Mycolicibacter sp. MYC017]